MLHGDISNQTGLTIAFRCEDCLFKFKDGKIIDKLLNAVVGKEKRATINTSYYNVMEFLYRNTEYTVDVVVETKNYTKALQNILDDTPFNRIIKVDKESQISSRLLTGDITYYIDENDYRRSLVNSKYAITLNDLNKFINRRVWAWNQVKVFL